MWIEANPGAVSVDANNIQSTPLVIRLWMGEGSTKVAVQAYLTLKVESVADTSVTTLYTYNSPSKVSEFSYTIPADKYATANRISVYAYEDSARTKEIDAKQVNIIADNPVPFPRPEAWAPGLTYKNGEILMIDGQVYMWMSRIPGNTAVNPKTDVSSASPSGKWKAYQHWPLLSTSILMAQFGLIGSAVFKDEYMMSQQGVDTSGTGLGYRGFPDTFTPNLLIDMLRGKIVCDDLTAKGFINTPFEEYNSPDEWMAGKSLNWYIKYASVLAGKLINCYLPKYSGAELCIYNASVLDIDFQVNAMNGVRQYRLPAKKLMRMKCVPKPANTSIMGLYNLSPERYDAGSNTYIIE